MTMSFDLDRARRDTPGCRNVLHFNNAGMSLTPTPVTAAYLAHLRQEEATGGYEAAREAEAASEHTYDAVARLLHCRRDEVALVENATRAWDMAFYGIPFQKGDRILTSTVSYASNFIAFLHVAGRTGAVVDVVPDDEYGQISVSALRDMIDDRVKLIALTHVPTNGGLVNPAEDVGRVARAAGVPYLLDACQSAGQMPLDVEALGCDMLSATGRKFLRGPRGTGFLYVRRSMIPRLDPPFLDLHAATWTAPDRYEMRPDARRFETWEGNVAGKIALGTAIDYALDWGLGALWERTRRLAADLRSRLAAMPHTTVHDKGRTKCGIVTFSMDAHPAEDLRRRLRDLHINVSVISPAASRLDADARALGDMVRASVHYYNAEEEIERFIRALSSVTQR